MELTSPAFEPGEQVPVRYTADGDRLSPPLSWSGVPASTRELALTLEDIDAREPRPFVHWIVYKIPPWLRALPEGVRNERMPEVPERVVQGTNSLGNIGYYGPAATVGRRHRLFFRLYALDAPLPHEPGMDPAAFAKAIEGHVIAEAELPATYVRTSSAPSGR